MDRKTKIWIVVLSLVCAAGLTLWLIPGASGGTVAVISINGEEYEKIDLSRVTEEYDIELRTEYGSNTVHVAPGAISVTAADCPDLVCVRQGELRQSGVPIICMPHRLVIAIEGAKNDA